MVSRAGPMMRGGTPLSELDEDDLLGRILPRFPVSNNLLVAPGDDAAVFASTGRTVATTDTVVLGRDWLDAWSSGADIGHKVIAQNLADIAAMGARPTGVLVTLVADPQLSFEWVLDHVDGVAQACREAGVVVLGGDLSSAPPGVVMVSVTALGEFGDPSDSADSGDPSDSADSGDRAAPGDRAGPDDRAAEPVLRSGARPGDDLTVCGSLGLADAGWRLLRADRAHRHPEAVARQRRPQPPLAAGPQAARSGASAMLDISDGLLRDGGRIARASEVVIDVDTTALAGDVAALADAMGAAVALECVLAGGEEHSLLATFPPGRMPPGWRRIGKVRAPGPGESPRVLVDGEPVTHVGWDHFRPDPG